MVVQCSNCQTRFRVAPEKVSPKGARMRCSKCKTIFNVPPAEERPTPSQGVQRATGLVAEADPDVAKKIMSLLLSWGIPSVAVHDGCEALLKLHRERPALVILGGHLPSVSAPVITEIVRRTAELRQVKLIRVATFDEPPGTPEFDAEHTLEPADLPDGLAPLLERLGLGRRPEPSKPESKAESQAASAAKKKSAKRVAAPVAEPAKEAAAPSSKGAAAPAKPSSGRRRRVSRPVSDDPQIAAAERLARIIVSDIILYNEAKFATGVKEGDVTTAVKNELNEGTQLFEQRIAAEVRQKRDFLGEELDFRASQLLAGA